MLLIGCVQQEFTSLADEYRGLKKGTLLNLLNLGRLLCEAKDKLPVGMFINFLNDGRVRESERTSQRLMSVYRDYRHILDSKIENDALNSLGVTHLLELKKLPDRFRKDIEIVKEVKGETTREIVSVIDEEKLSDFLDTRVKNKNGEEVNMSDLSVDEMRKYINEAKGTFEPTEEQLFSDDSDTSDSDEIDSIPVVEMNSVDYGDDMGAEAIEEAKQEVINDSAELNGLIEDVGKICGLIGMAVARLEDVGTEQMTTNDIALKNKFLACMRQGENKAKDLQSVCGRIHFKYTK